MKDLSNIETSAFKPKQYVGYANGVWRIFKRNGQWEAHRRPSGFLSAASLEEMSQKLIHFAEQEKEANRGTDNDRLATI